MSRLRSRKHAGDELAEILDRRKRNMVRDCDLISHHDGQQIADYRKCWHTACVTSGLGAYYCRNCRDESGRYISLLDTEAPEGNCDREKAV